MHLRQLRKELTELIEMARTHCCLRLRRRGYLAHWPCVPRQTRIEYERLLARPVRDAPFIVFDTETTGFEPYGGDALVQVAFIEYHGLEPTGREFCSLVQPGIPIPRRSSAIHGISNAMVRGAPTARELIDEIVEFTAGHILVAHHIAFDMRFLDRVTRHCMLGEFPNPRIDTAMMWLASGGARDRIGLDYVAHSCGIEITSRHDARGDALACGQVFAHLAGRLTWSKTTVGELLERVHPIAGLSPRHPAAPRVPPPTPPSPTGTITVGNHV